MTKSLEDNFTDWESDTFGFGYGSGEMHTLAALRFFLSLCNRGAHARQYDYEVLERELTPTVAWLLINILARARILEYGTSPRYAWLTPEGEALKAFVTARSVEELYELTSRDENYIGCSFDSCNCGPNGYEKGLLCVNPFWRGHSSAAVKTGTT